MNERGDSQVCGMAGQQTPAHYLSVIEIHDGGQIHESAMKRDVGEVV